MPEMSELECFVTYEFEQDVAVDGVTICEWLAVTSLGGCKELPPRYGLYT